MIGVDVIVIFLSVTDVDVVVMDVSIFVLAVEVVIFIPGFVADVNVVVEFE